MAAKAKVSIREARSDEIDAVLQFLRDHYYIKDHVYTRRRDLFLEHHFVNGKLCFVIAVDDETDEIVGVAGYFPSNSGDSPDLFVSMLQTTKTGNSLIGLQMVKACQDFNNARCLISAGCVKSVLPIYRYMGYETGDLTHYYRYFTREEYKVACIVDARPQPYAAGNAQLVEYTTMDEVREKFDFDACREHIPFKDADFVALKYFGNLGYAYRVFGIEDAGTCTALMIGRDAEHDGEKAFKIIDFIGTTDGLCRCGRSIDDRFQGEGYEFIDFYGYGFDDSAWSAAGFLKLDADDANIIPHYFEPYEAENIDIHFFTSVKDNCTVTRADGGQDRPNFLEEGE